MIWYTKIRKSGTPLLVCIQRCLDARTTESITWKNWQGQLHSVCQNNSLKNQRTNSNLLARKLCLISLISKLHTKMKSRKSPIGLSFPITKWKEKSLKRRKESKPETKKVKIQKSRLHRPQRHPIPEGEPNKIKNDSVLYHIFLSLSNHRWD